MALIEGLRVGHGRLPGIEPLSVADGDEEKAIIGSEDAGTTDLPFCTSLDGIFSSRCEEHDAHTL